MNHTKTPWTHRRATKPHGIEQSIDCAILDAENEIIAETFEKVGRTSEGAFLTRPAEANAAHIVHCVNSYHLMKLALVQCQESFADYDDTIARVKAVALVSGALTVANGAVTQEVKP